jgi:hypothetical protein
MASGKFLVPNGVLIECYIWFWDLGSEDCCRMIQTTIKEEHLPMGMNKGLISLLHIGGEKKNLRNWWSISLLNVFYKFFGKNLIITTLYITFKTNLNVKLLTLINPCFSHLGTFWMTCFWHKKLLIGLNALVKHWFSSSLTLRMLFRDAKHCGLHQWQCHNNI